MVLTIVTAPAIEPLTLDEVTNHLRLSETVGSAENSIITGFLGASRRYCEQVHGRAYIEQTWKLVLDDFPAGKAIEIPRPPLMSVTHVKYYDINGSAGTMTAANYYVDTDSEPGRVHLQYGETWPSETLRPAAGVEVEFVAGYGSAASAVPAEFKQAICLLVGTMYERRESTDIKEIHQVPDGTHALLGLDRIWPV